MEILLENYLYKTNIYNCYKVVDVGIVVISIEIGYLLNFNS